jgi:hypothetical protein
MARGFLTAISKCKEQKLVLLPEKAKEVSEKITARCKALQNQTSDEVQEEVPVHDVNSTAITLQIVDK